MSWALALLTYPSNSSVGADAVDAEGDQEVFRVDDDWAALVADDVDPAIAMTLVGPAEPRRT